MSGPFVYIGTNTIKEGKVEECRTMLNEIAQLVEAHEPRVIAFNFYVDEPNRKAVCVQVHPDSASMDTHMQVIAEHLKTAYDVLEETTSEQLYGPGGEQMVDEFRQWAPNATFTVIPQHEVGFTRSAAAG
jgi:quinol monooxygenase YgiN